MRGRKTTTVPTRSAALPCGKMTELRKNGRWGTAHIYQSTLNVFSVFNNYQNLHLRKWNPVVLKRFEMHLRQRDCSWNTVSTYMKVIRSAYNRAVDLRCVRYTPRFFEHVYTGCLLYTSHH